MNAVALPFDEWQLRFHEAMAAVLRAHDTIKREVGIIGIARRLWLAARDLRNIVRLEEVLLATPDGMLTDALLEEATRSTGELVRSINDLLDTAKRYRFTNRTLTAGSLESIRRYGEEIAEHLDALQLSLDPEVGELIRQGRQDFAEGRGVPLSSLRQG